MDRVEELHLPAARVWSTTALKTMGTCGHQFFLRYMQPTAKSTPTPPLVFGSAVHKMLERIHLEQIWEERHWQRIWVDEWYDYAAQADWSHYRKSIYDKLGPVMIADYISKNKDVEVLETEFPFEFKIAGYPVRGVIDQVRKLKNGKIVIVDFKTSKDEPDPLLLRADPQFTIYWLFGQEKYGKNVSAAWMHLKTGKLIPTQRRPEDADIVIAMLREGQTRVDQELFAKNVGYSCNYCPFKQECLGSLGEHDAQD